MMIKNIARVFLLLSLLLPTLVSAKEDHLVRLQRLIDEHTAVVQNKIVNSWTLPTTSEAKLSCAIEVTVAMDGKVTGTRVVNSSGNTDYDRSVEVAVTSSSPLPIAADPEVMDRFRTLRFNFRSGGSENTDVAPAADTTLGYSNYVQVKSPIYIDK